MRRSRFLSIRCFLLALLFVLAAAAAVALCLSPVSAEETPGLAIATAPYHNEVEDRYYLNKTHSGNVAVTLSGGADAFYYAVTSEETADDAWYEQAVWKRGAGGKVHFADGARYSVAFVPVTGAKDAEYENFAALAAAYPAVSAGSVVQNASLRDFGVDTVAPEVGIKAFDRQYVDKTYSFADVPATDYASGLMEIAITRDAALHPDAAQDLYVDAEAPRILKEDDYNVLYRENALVAAAGITLWASAAEQQKVNMRVLDNAGNGALDDVTFYLGIPAESAVRYADEWDPKNADSFPKAAADQLAAAEDLPSARKTAFDTAIWGLKRAYNALDSSYLAFGAEVSRLTTAGVTVTEDTVKRFAELFLQAESLAASLTPEQAAKAETEGVLKRFEERKQEFAAKRLTSVEAGVTLIAEGMSEGDGYYLYLAAGKLGSNFKSYADRIGSSLKDTKLRQVYTLRLLSAKDGTDRTEALDGKRVTLKIALDDGYRNNTPTAVSFTADSFKGATAAVGNGVLTVTLADGLADVGLCVAKGPNYFLIVGLPVILGVLLLAGIAVLAVYLVKKGKKPDEKLTELEKKLEEQKKITEIARKAKEEEERINLEKQAEIERQRLEAIERVKEERRKALEEKERLLREEAEKSQSALAAAQLAEFERMARERAEAERAKAEAQQKPAAKKKASSKKKTETGADKPAGKTAGKKKTAAKKPAAKKKTESGGKKTAGKAGAKNKAESAPTETETKE